MTTSALFNNVYSGADFRFALSDAFAHIADMLAPFSGPSATFAAIGSKHRQLDDVDEHTKDGIKILSYMLSDKAAIPRYAARTTRFIGRAIESRCSDGTTTAMSLFALLASSVLSTTGTRIAHTIFGRKVEDELSLLIDRLATARITAEEITEKAIAAGLSVTLADTRRALAYHQALIATKGNRMMSEAIAEVVSSTPINTYGLFLRETAPHETDLPVELITKACQMNVPAGIGSQNAFNHKLGSMFYSKNACVISTSEELNDGVFVELYLNALIGEQPRDVNYRGLFGISQGWSECCGGRQLVIVSPMMQSQRLIQNIAAFNKENPKTPIVWFNIGIDGELCEIFDRTLHAIAGIPTFNQVESETYPLTTIENVEVTFKRGQLEFSGLYERDGQVLHPYAENPELSSEFTEFRKEIEDVLEFADAHPAESPFTSSQIDFIIRMYRYMMCQVIRDVVLGGTVHDNKAMRTVYDDAMGAALSSVSDGVVLGGYAQILRLLRSRRGPFVDILNERIREVITNSLDASEYCLPEKYFQRVDSKWKYPVLVINSEEKSMFRIGHLTGKRLEKFYSGELDEPILFQSYVGFIEQLRRFRDLLPKLTHLSTLIDGGHMNNVENSTVTTQ